MHKVGFTRENDPENRVKEWEKISGEKYTLLEKFRTDHPEYLEEAFHECFKSNRVVKRDPVDPKGV